MKSKISRNEIVAIGLMLFALFFGAGNLIFPPALGQAAGTNLLPSMIGFLLTGVGLPLLGVLAIGVSGHSDVQSLANKVNPAFSLIFTVVLYLSIGPFFAIPRTGTVSFEIGIAPFFPDMSGGFNVALLIYTIIYFTIVGYLSLNPSKIVDRVGKVMTPILLICLLIVLIATVINPINEPAAPIGSYVDNAFFKGFQEGYLTMDTLASFVFGIIVINAIKENGITTKAGIAKSTIKAGLIAAGALGVIYFGLAYLGATTNYASGQANNGGAILTYAANAHFSVWGNAILGFAIVFACLTTSIGLISSCASYFSKMFPRFSYKTLAIVFTIFSAAVANVGLSLLITISVPVLVAIYPLAIVLIFLTFTDPLFKGRVSVYRWSMLFTGIFSAIDGIKAAGIQIEGLYSLLNQYLPLFEAGMGWVLPALAGAVIGLMFPSTKKPDSLTKDKISLYN
ncbi:branched-chain amino acid transport system II carrier protein [Niallia endozanthoxylica]|uniref:Branched-chain amino acid transport system carrier protein n=1 Tax=Niallia endozanthoxylica TaxID=2036016 RepID=A0A5J5HGN4_9BACI|nr:branched-chain amino acid transport system II carrier protein [Niallia endozanthoxylica]KAA9019930.1 branched-chain amino acid transport system II carrier protein [Niallia endozanthoxylica]